MCGICGIVGETTGNEEKVRKVRAMVEQLKHRGPEYSSYSRFGNAVLGHSRLKIIDTTDKSNQPFLNLGGDKALVYNGECYNYRTLGKEIQNRGFPLATEGDTEVVFNLLSSRGIHGLNEIDGIFGLGFWDRRTQKLLLARDRMGVKPVYYSFQQSELYFASELRSLLEVLPHAKLSEQGMAEYLAYQSHPSQHTLVEGIHMLPAGSYLEFNPGQKGKITPYYYYMPARILDTPSTAEEISAKSLRECLVESVQKRLISDVPLGVFLSGGMDSTAMTGLMRQATNTSIKTFTFGFEGEDERPVARRVSELYGTEHTEVELGREEVARLVPEAVDAMDAPSGDAVNAYLISKFAKEAGITVALSGLGGDELFGGYPSYTMLRRSRSLKLLKSIRPLLRAPGIRQLIERGDRHSGKLQTLLSRPIAPYEIVEISRRMFLDHEIQELGIGREVDYYIDKPGGENQLADELLISLFELIYYTRPLLLKDTDQMGMAHGLEIRVPFMDSHLWDKLLSLPVSDVYPDRSVSKSGLLQNLNSQIPDYVYKRSKQGFILPMESWIKGPLAEFTADGLFQSPLTKVLRRGTLDALWYEFGNNSTVSWSRIWTLSVLGHWLHKNNISI